MATKQKTLVIVESPSKAKTIAKYLGSSYKVTASVGHVRDLLKSSLSIDLENNFEPKFAIIKGKGSTVKELKEEAKSAGKVLLATDPDREGEAISWHLAYILGMDPNTNCRITFNEVTKKAVTEAVKNPRSIDLNLVDAYLGRRILDRLVGYLVSPVLWTKVKKDLSAGRVQSAALKIICDREREIQNFVAKEYWNLSVDFKKEKAFQAKLSEYLGKKVSIENEGEANNVIAALGAGKYVVSEITNKERVRKPFAPYTTSTLQQDASNKINFTSSRTMKTAQQLYEGIDVKGVGNSGLITYIRTDSVRISNEARQAAKEYIEAKFGKNYVGENFYSNKKKEIQDAHEAIRPTHIEWDPELLKDSLTQDQYKLYKLVWLRFVASQMAASVFDVTQVEIKNGDYTLKASGSKRNFDGYQKIYAVNFEEDKDMLLPALTVGEELKAVKVNKEQKFTEPPSRFTEASLIKELEENNIGRPSTYATIMSTLTSKNYVTRVAKALAPSDLGVILNDYMVAHFNDIVDAGFTANMEDKLDDVEMNKAEWRKVVGDFYDPLKDEIELAKGGEKVKMPTVLAEGEFCEKCGKPLAIKESRFGQFLACTGFPDCKFTKSIVDKIDVKCPDCGSDIIAKKTKRGKTFYGCSNFPKCNRAFWDKPTTKKCPVCGEVLVEKRIKNTKLTCSNANCNYKE